MDLTEYINETNSCITEINKTQRIIIVDDDGNETDLSLKCLIKSEENIIYGWCQAKSE